MTLLNDKSIRLLFTNVHTDPYFVKQLKSFSLELQNSLSVNLLHAF